MFITPLTVLYLYANHYFDEGGDEHPYSKLVSDVSILEGHAKKDACPYSSGPEKIVCEMEVLKDYCEDQAKKWKDFYEGIVVMIIGYSFLFASLGFSSGIPSGGFLWFIAIFIIDVYIIGPLWASWARSKYKMFKRKVEELEREIRMFRMVKALKE